MIWSVFLILAELVNFQPSGKCIYNQKFGQLDDDTPLINKFIEVIPTLQDYDSGNMTLGKIQFIYSGYDDVLFVICADKSENPLPVLQALESLKVSFVQNYFSLIRDGQDDSSSFSSLQKEVEQAFSKFIQFEEPLSNETEESASAPSQPESSAEETTKQIIKIAFIGETNVGKRTLANLLFSSSGDVKVKGVLSEEAEMIMRKGVLSEKYNVLLITISNQMMQSGKTQFLSNTDVVLLVTNSVFKNVMATRKILDIVKEILPNAHYGVIANKQDVSGAVDVEAIRKIYDLPIIPMAATYPSNTEDLKAFIINLIEES